MYRLTNIYFSKEFHFVRVQADLLIWQFAEYNLFQESVQDVELVEDIELSPDSGSSLARTRKTEDESSGPVDRKRAKV